MKALVLTCDRYHQLAIHMVESYNRLWPKHPFIFRIPFQKDTVSLDVLDRTKLETIECGGGILDTVWALLADVDDEEWVYWCIDDKYPISLDVENLERVISGIENCSVPAAAILLCRPLKLYKASETFAGVTWEFAGSSFLRRKNYSQIWMHQFLKGKVLKDMFARFESPIGAAKEMDRLKDMLTPPSGQFLYVIDHSRSLYGESTSRGYLTLNCAFSFFLKGKERPNAFKLGLRVIVIGVGSSLIGSFPLILKILAEIVVLRGKIFRFVSENIARMLSRRDAVHKRANR